MKKTKVLYSLFFVLRWKDRSTIPRFLQFRHHIQPAGFTLPYDA
jgi:hypothetical protein